MKQTKSYADDRHLSWCAHCGGPTETDDHVPAKVFLDKPYPDQLAKVLSCEKCNVGLALDEEYLACFIECVIAGSTDPRKIVRSRIRQKLEEKPSLVVRIERSKIESERGTEFKAEGDRARRVIQKFATGLALYELGEPQFGNGMEVYIFPLSTLSTEQRAYFETSPAGPIWPEVGSRAMQRLIDPLFDGWISVQEGNFRYLAAYNECAIVRMVFREYLGCEVFFRDIDFD